MIVMYHEENLRTLKRKNGKEKNINNIFTPWILHIIL